MRGKESPAFEVVRDKLEALRARCATEEETNAVKLQNKEAGCHRPLYNGEKGKCVISIIPNTEENKNVSTFNIANECVPNNISLS